MGKAVNSKRKYQKHDDQFRASAVCMLESQGYPDAEGALAIVAKHLRVSQSTLRGWFRGTSNPPPANIRAEKRDDFKTLFINEIYEILKVLPDHREEATYQQLTTSLAIFFDKIRLLEGLPTEIIGVLPALVDELKAIGVNPVDAFQEMLNRAKAQREVMNADR